MDSLRVTFAAGSPTDVVAEVAVPEVALAPAYCREVFFAGGVIPVRPFLSLLATFACWWSSWNRLADRPGIQMVA